MTAGALEHGELVNMLADEMVSAADDLLRHHLSRVSLGQLTPALLASPEVTHREGT